jgi:hypothetical protein
MQAALNLKRLNNLHLSTRGGPVLFWREERRRAMRGTLLLVATIVITVLLGVGSASADPLNSNNAVVFTLDCGGEEVKIVTKLNGTVVGHVVDSTDNFVVTKFEETRTYTDPETGKVVHEERVSPVGEGQKQGLQPSLITCHQEEPIIFEDPELGTVTVDLTVTGFFAPRAEAEEES